MSEPKKPIVFPEIDTSGRAQGLTIGWPTIYADSRKHREWEWTQTVIAYEENPEDLYRVWWWLARHPIFYYFGSEKRRHEATLISHRGVQEGLEIVPAMVSKKTRKTEGRWEDRELELWVEVFPASLTRGTNDIRLHDIELDTGAPVYEEALIKTAALIYEHHGNDREALKKKWSGA